MARTVASSKGAAVTALSAWEAAARLFEPKPRKWATPGEMAVALDPATTLQTPALLEIDRRLVRVADTPGAKLMVFMPPQEGKSERISRRFPTWVLSDINPDWRIAIVSYADEMARRWGSAIKLDAATHDGTEDTIDLGIKLRDDSRAAGRWQIAGRAGGVYCVGIGGALSGRPVDLLIIDDPIKDLEHAQSSVYRDRAKRFWRAVAVPRMAPHTRTVIVQTRWNEDDLSGWLLHEDPDAWDVLSIPALAESYNDPLGRLPGEAMASARGERDWKHIRADVGEYVFAALYQQRPAPAEGGLFRREAWRYWTPAGGYTGARMDLGGRQVDWRDCWRFATVDLAASTKTSADWTVASAWALDGERDLILLDRIRAHAAPGEHWTLVRTLCDRFRIHDVGVESGMAATTLVRDATNAGVGIFALTPDTDKFTRALPAAARVDAGKVFLPAGALWLGDWVDEHAAFPNGAHDDQVDTLAYAVNVAAGRWSPGGDRPSADPPPQPDLSWDGKGAVDLASAPF